MTCKGCGNDKAYRVRTVFAKGQAYDECDRCTTVSMSETGSPDVYWPGHAHYNPNLVDKKTGQPVLLTSRRHKAEVMKSLNVREAGDRDRGARQGEASGNWRTR